MSVSRFVRVDAEDPEAVDLTITNEDGQTADLTTVSGVVLLVRRPDGTSAEWLTTILSATTTTVEVRHVFASGDVPKTGAYHIRPRMYFPGDVIRRARALDMTVVCD